jgi:glycosyltransferase involved in cell wall biosynthesis
MSSMSKPRFSIIIAQGRASVEETLQSVLKQDFEADGYEVILVSERDSVPREDERCVRRVFARHRNPAYKRNLGVAHAAGRILAFIDDDAVAPPDWLADAERLLNQSIDAAGLGGANVLPPSSSLRERLSDAVLSLPLLGAGSSSYSATSEIRSARPGEVHLANMFVRRDVFEAVGGLNEAVGYGGEDSEIVMQIRRRTGRDFLYSGGLVVQHRRRPFGVAYLRQRFRFRVNNGRLALAFPSLYARSPGFWFMAAAPLLGAGAVAAGASVALSTLGVYLAALGALATVRTPRLAPLVVPAAPLHHLAYATGFWTGVLSGLLHPALIRAIRNRAPLFPRSVTGGAQG